MITTAIVTTGLQQDTGRHRQTIGVITVPLGQVLPFVDFPQNPTIDVPSINSIVLVMVHDSANAIYLCKLVDPNNDLSRTSLTSPSGGKPFIEAGEYQLSVGSGASILLNNNGGIHLTSGSVKDEIVIDNDTIKVQSSVVDIHSVPKALAAQGFMSMNAKIALDNPVGLDKVEFGIRNPQTGLVLYSISLGGLGEIIVKNTLAGGSITISPVGTVTVASPVNVSIVAALNVTIAAAAKVSIAATEVSVTATDVAVTAAVVSVTAPRITLGGPTGQALATEAFVKTAYDQHTHMVSSVGTPTSVPLLPSTAIVGVLTTTTKAL